METYLKIILDLETQLSGIKDVSENVTDQMEFAIGQCKVALEKLRKRVLEKGFPDRQSEIRFFKEVKPAAYGKLMFYQLVFDIECKRKKADISVNKRYLQKYLYKINEYMEEHHVKVQYYRCGFKHLDEQYFLRENSEIPLELKNSHQLLDEEFFTWHDHTFSMIMANEMLSDYIHKELEKLENPEKDMDAGLKSKYRWTGKKIDIGEIVYAFYYAKVINSGNITIKELAEVFDQMLGTDLAKDIYRLHLEIRQRKIDRTKFLDLLRSILRQRLDEEDE
ncbi:MAG: hypothetical protein A2W90_19140 [Bacteroidetes bacterium GWF2_42_66]|nr:MAG: hypothetical protein A2W92_05955 [Bacteroidetes bacterium GWA2_42_15]OFX98716.1 MAG: hypothetical protein A2W89_10550 [Bacteroidetes bacterium GWE2_42_39]OFY43085.1 MAG: hypothetical protein A2W90_19140 [Bacteroidetes bacterium GWF2_42_66]HBL77069.1 hypothetical protein [Prolixibacteraceae bacterium]HCR89577.1 hypothetical protein [Prolixibacteraceae bacterium]